MKLSGKTLTEIADELGYRSTTEVAHAISDRMKLEAAYMTEAGWTGILQMELDRLDRLQSRLWPAAMTGDPKSVEAVLKVMDRRIKITGIDSLDTSTQQAAVLVVSGNEKSYVDKLRELVEE